MSPDYIVTDELGADAESIRQAVNSGSGLIMTAHADSIEEAYRNEGIRTVIDSGAIQHIALVQSHRITAVKQLITAEANAVGNKKYRYCSMYDGKNMNKLKIPAKKGAQRRCDGYVFFGQAE